MPEGRRRRGVTPHPRSGAVAESTRLRRRRNGQEELPHVRGQGGPPRGDTQSPRSGVAARRRYPTPLSWRPGATAGRSYPRPHARGQGRWPGGATHPRGQGQQREELPGVVAAPAQEGLEELSHIEGQEGRH